MTFSQAVKEELCSAKFSCDACNYAFVYAMLLFRNCEDPGILFESDNPRIIDLLALKIVEFTGVIAATDMVGAERKKHHVYRLFVENTEDVPRFYETFSDALYFKFSAEKLKKNCCHAAFLRGVFLSCGVLVNPEREYHFEFKIHHETLAVKLHEFLQVTGLPFKLGERKGNYIIYLKGSEPIEEMLTFMGASKSALRLMDVKILKDVRNKVNRVTNCETANIGKTVRAAMRQVDDIQTIFSIKGEDYLSADLLAAAKARLENPELSLNELLEVMGSGISRSGLNHRLSKLSKIAEELRTN